MSTETEAAYLFLGSRNLPGPTIPPLPPAPTRDFILTAPWRFQGVTVTTSQFGRLPWFDVAIASLVSEADRQSVYSQLLAAGSRCMAIAVSWSYYEPGQPYFDIVGRDFSQELPALCALLREAVVAGFYPYLFLAGDGQSINDNPQPRQYDDPVGSTYGYQWLKNNLERIVSAVRDAGLLPYTVFVPGFDGVFYGWTPEQVTAFGAQFRNLVPQGGHLAIEHNTGHIPIGNGPVDYAVGGPMQPFDAILSEFDQFLHQDSCWQIAARLLGPAYVRPPDQPEGDDPGPAPFYLSAGTPRGRYYTRAFEFDEFRWVRSRVSVEEIQRGRDYLRAMGYRITG